MKAKVSEQDLTDYALNELGPEERIYVETVLAGSEEAREDVYAMIDLAMTLEAGFDRQERRAPAELTTEQHQALMTVRGPNIFLRNTVALLAAAACAAFAFVQREAWLPQLHLRQNLTASNTVAQTSAQQKATAENPDLVTQVMQVTQLTPDEPLLRKWLQSLPGVSSPAPTANYDVPQPSTLDGFESLMP
jgi:anti-sigma factor RsiW